VSPAGACGFESRPRHLRALSETVWRRGGVIGVLGSLEIMRMDFG
jgi:hypothetical protein